MGPAYNILHQTDADQKGLKLQQSGFASQFYRIFDNQVQTIDTKIIMTHLKVHKFTPDCFVEPTVFSRLNSPIFTSLLLEKIKENCERERDSEKGDLNEREKEKV